MHVLHYAALFGAAMLAGAINSVAGGGTLIAFPLLLHFGVNPIVANVTTTTALCPGQLGSLWGYRKEISSIRPLIIRLLIPSLAGGFLGGYLLLRTDSETFAHLIPFLILAATLLFLAQEPVSRWLKKRTGDKAVVNEDGSIVPQNWLGVMLFQFGIAVYGGYFGAGIGILMLAALGILGLTDIHRMNGLKSINGFAINVVASVIFIVKGKVDLPIAGLMAVGAVLGGYFGAGIAKRIGQKNVRRTVIAIGFILTAQQLYQVYFRQQS